MKIQNKSRYFRYVALLLALLIPVLSLAGCAGSQNLSPETLAEQTAAFLLKADPSADSDWTAFGLARWNGAAGQEWLTDYYTAAEARVTDCQGVLHERKYTEYSRLILALTALGKNPANVAGYDLLLPLADFDQTVFQGVNGAVVALLALDSGSYEIPENAEATTQATRELYLDYILNAQLPNGGWALAGGEPEIDLTAMALQALAGYRDREDADQAIEKALVILSQRQNAQGGYTAYGVESSEAISQTIIALAALDIPLEDPRFVKDGSTLLDALLRFRQKDGGFSHLLGGKTDRLATEQALCALVALVRMEKGSSALYRIR